MKNLYPKLEYFGAKFQNLDTGFIEKKPPSNIFITNDVVLHLILDGIIQDR